MKAFLETTFGPTELAILDQVLKEWIAETGVARDSLDAELAAAVMINLFREGNDTAPALQAAISGHQGLADLVRGSSSTITG
jgi:hypothetical protein